MHNSKKLTNFQQQKQSVDFYYITTSYIQTICKHELKIVRQKKKLEHEYVVAHSTLRMHSFFLWMYKIVFADKLRGGEIPLPGILARTSWHEISEQFVPKKVHLHSHCSTVTTVFHMTQVYDAEKRGGGNGWRVKVWLEISTTIISETIPTTKRIKWRLQAKE